MIHFLSFADSRMTPSLRRIRKEAKNTGWFDTITVVDESYFDKSYMKMIKSTLHMRGFGYWRWKSYIVLKKLSEIAVNDILLYLDAGCTINPKGQARFAEYLKLVENNADGMLFFEQEGQLEKQWTKMDLIIHAKGNLNDNQIFAGIFMLKKQKSTMKLVNEWYDLCNNHFDLITDSPSIIPNDSSFVENRHDQSALSLLARKYNPILLNVLETWTNGDFLKDLSSFPFWATRNKQISKWVTVKITIISWAVGVKIWMTRLVK